MNDLNSVLIEGNLTRDPRVAATPKGTPVCNFSVASNRYFRADDEMQEEVSFFDVETWSRLAERCGEELHKGRGVRVVGRLKQDRWQDKDGNPRSRTKIVAEHVEFRRPRLKQDEPETTIEDGEELEAAAAAAAAAVAEEKEAVPVF
ncbi:MAG: single-stranded DNA-binding protein [Spirochaetota bacterium]